MESPVSILADILRYARNHNRLFAPSPYGSDMKRGIVVIVISAVLCTGQVHAATAPTPAKTTTSQQDRVKGCAAQYHQKNITRSQYRNFMSGCLKNSGTTTATKPAAAK